MCPGVPCGIISIPLHFSQPSLSGSRAAGKWGAPLDSAGASTAAVRGPARSVDAVEPGAAPALKGRWGRRAFCTSFESNPYRLSSCLYLGSPECYFSGQEPRAIHAMFFL